MEHTNSTTRLSSRLDSLQDKITLIQTDTTVGFVSKNSDKLTSIKERQKNKEFLKVYSSFKNLTQNSHRVPNRFKNIVRRANKSTFVTKNRAFRVVHSGIHHEFLKKFGWIYSTSANRSRESYNFNFCFSNSDIIVEDFRGLFESSSSSIVKLNNKKREKLR